MASPGRVLSPPGRVGAVKAAVAMVAVVPVVVALAVERQEALAVERLVARAS